nr:hypothetical protein [Desulfobacterales bacterium]
MADQGYELTDEDKAHIRKMFHEVMVPKLIKYNARIGNLNCEFAGDRYKDWNIVFMSDRSSFEIVEFEYDKDSRSLDLK